MNGTANVTKILSQIEHGDAFAAEQLLPLVYGELRKLAAAKMAHEKPGQTLQATALVHEAYIRLLGPDGSSHWDDRGHFFAAAAEAMRRILINRARDKKRIKRGGGRIQFNLEHVELALDTPPDELIALNEAMQLLDQEDLVCAQLVKLRFFAGLTLQQAADALGISHRTADRQWAYARAWLYDQLREEEDDSAD